MRFFTSPGLGYTVQSDAVQVRIDETDAKELIESVLRFMQIDRSALNPGNAEWLYGPIEAGAPESLEARLMAGAVWGINRAMLDAETGRQRSEERISNDGYVWAFTSEDDAKREAASLSRRNKNMGVSRGRRYRYSVTPFTLEEAVAASEHGYALNGNHPDAPARIEGSTK